MLYVLMRYDDDITDTTPKSGYDMSGCGLSKSGVGKDIALKRRDKALLFQCKSMEALKNIIQCHKMVKVSCIFKGVVRAVKADQRFFKGITGLQDIR